MTASPQGEAFGCSRTGATIAQKKSYHFPGNNAVGNALWRRNNLAFGHGGVYNENDRVCGYEQLEVICHGS